MLSLVGTFHFGFTVRLCFQWLYLNIMIPLENVPFRWADKAIMFLGTHITRETTDFKPLLHNIKHDLMQWHALTLTWFGCCSAFKMVIVPRILFLLQTLLLQLPA